MGLGALMRRAMAEGHWTFRTLAERTRELDPRGRGLTYSYLSTVARGQERPRTDTIRLICEALELDPDDVAEYRLALAREQLDEREVGLDQALENLAVIEAALMNSAPARARRGVDAARGSAETRSSTG